MLEAVVMSHLSPLAHQIYLVKYIHLHRHLARGGKWPLLGKQPHPGHVVSFISPFLFLLALALRGAH